MKLLTNSDVLNVVIQLRSTLEHQGYTPDVLPQLASAIMLLYVCSVLAENQDKPDVIAQLSDMVRLQANHVVEGLYKYRAGL